ncbi:hypothetical protein DIURU_005215 [Diutina rugosa]|uniref:Uncharacterized protein n=1 Tax=Diutina rugosa TaxID=5481 RepID=A0A642UL99_DIURU|nr:uncharacterized protein DIURU_005215 [Diutina rugosa]KAA8897499.1 hypothetical protein DIURU_005215 [Diutina rugosa]
MSSENHHQNQESDSLITTDEPKAVTTTNESMESTPIPSVKGNIPKTGNPGNDDQTEIFQFQHQVQVHESRITELETTLTTTTFEVTHLKERLATITSKRKLRSAKKNENDDNLAVISFAGMIFMMMVFSFMVSQNWDITRRNNDSQSTTIIEWITTLF